MSELDEYTTYMSVNPGVVRVFDPCKLPDEVLDAFVDSLLEAESTGLPPQAPMPEAYLNRDPDRSYVHITPEEAYLIAGAKFAHIFFVEINALVPWSISDYDADSLTSVFDLCKRFSCYADEKTFGFHFNNVLDHSPRDTWSVVEQYLDLEVIADPRSAIAGMLRETRYFRHGSPDLDPSLGIITVDEMAIEKVSRRGCWSMSPYLVSLAAALNIPGEQIYGYYDGGRHLTVAFETIDGVLSHGDHPYDASLKGASSGTLLDSLERWEDEVLRYKPLEGSFSQAGHASKIHKYRIARQFPSSWLISRYCGGSINTSPDFGFLESFFGDYATFEELDNLESRILELTSGCSSIPDDPVEYR